MSSAVEREISVGRRGFLARGFWAALATVSAGLATPLVGYFFGPLLRKKTESLLRLGAVEDFPVDTPTRVETAFRRRDGWVAEEGQQAAWVVRRADRLLVFDPRCTHLSCAYHWHAQSKQFLCPCHNGVYDLEGRVVSGPPPRPLDTFDTTIRDGTLFVLPVPRRRA